MNAGAVTRSGSGDWIMGAMGEGGPELSWTDAGHPELEGEPILSTINGPLQVPPKPPPPGRRYGSGRVFP